MKVKATWHRLLYDPETKRNKFTADEDDTALLDAKVTPRRLYITLPSGAEQIVPRFRRRSRIQRFWMEERGEKETEFFSFRSETYGLHGHRTPFYIKFEWTKEDLDAEPKPSRKKYDSGPKFKAQEWRDIKAKYVREFERLHGKTPTISERGRWVYIIADYSYGVSYSHTREEFAQMADTLSKRETPNG